MCESPLTPLESLMVKDPGAVRRFYMARKL